MPVTVVRFNLVAPGATPAELGARYRAALEMAAYADDRGVTTVQTEEHHGAGNNWLPSPFAFAGAVFGATRRVAVTVSAIIGPLHDPLRLAEEIAVLDLLSGGRLVTVAGIGYRPEEYDQFGVDFKRRGRLQDELLETLLQGMDGRAVLLPGPHGPRSLRARSPNRTRCSWSAAPPRPPPAAPPGWACRSSPARICRSWRRTTRSSSSSTAPRAGP